MNKSLVSLAAILALASTSFANDTIADAFKNGKTSGEIRIGHVNQDNDNPAANSDSKNSAVGGHIAYETGTYKGVSLGAAFYTTKRIESKNNNGAGTSLFDSQDDGYSILGQAYVNIALSNTNLRVGRQQIDTPYADSDDIRMIPNLFEAYVLSNSDIEDLTLIAAKVNSWSGVDSGTPEKFTELVAGGDGVVMLAGIYGGIKNSEISAWYYGVDKLTDILYLEAATSFDLGDGFGVGLGAQYANLSEDTVNGVKTGTDGSVFGISAELGIESAGVTLSAAYNNVDTENTKSVTNGFGGGPYMTSMDEQTIDGLNGDVKAWTAGISFDLSKVGAEGLNFSYLYGDFEDGLSGAAKNEYTENDFVLEYAFNDNLSGVAIYTMLDHDLGGLNQTDSFDRLQAYINYSF